MPAWRQSRPEHGEKTPDVARPVSMGGLYVQITENARNKTGREVRQT